MGTLVRARLVSTPPIEWAAAGRALRGQDESGDLHVVAPFASGVLIAVIDGLGHGPEAAAAARLAAEVVTSHPAAPPMELVRACHERLRASRGAVMSLASIDGTTGAMTWVGVGNVEGLLVTNSDDGVVRQVLSLRGGVLGAAKLRASSSSIQLSPRSLLVMATDGITSDFAETVNVRSSPELIAQDILDRCARHSDDALVLAARFEGLSA